MAKDKKFNFRITQNENMWTAEIIRRVTSKKTHVSKSQSGFSNETDAKEWGQTELKHFLQNLNQRNKKE